MSEPNAQEPTMEEILASIRRIISEDEQPADAEGAEAEYEAEPEPEPAPEPVAAAAPEAMPSAFEPQAEPEEDVLELTERAPEPVESIGDLDLYPPADARPKADMTYAAPAAADASTLVSEPVAASAANAFGHLAQRVAMPREGRTLEDVVRDMLNPLLKAWLDEHLPAIVQAKVEEEVERIARRRG